MLQHLDMILKNKILAQYQNGNTSVKIYEDGTKIREYEGTPKTFFPESLDVKITDYCDLGCKFCLDGDSLIQTSSGEIPIKELMPGDLVYTYNEKTGDTELNKVIEPLSRKYSGKMIHLILDDGKEIHLTPDHKVYTQNDGWKIADNLTLEDNILIF